MHWQVTIRTQLVAHIGFIHDYHIGNIKHITSRMGHTRAQASEESRKHVGKGARAPGFTFQIPPPSCGHRPCFGHSFMSLVPRTDSYKSALYPRACIVVAQSCSAITSFASILVLCTPHLIAHLIDPHPTGLYAY